MLAVTPNNLVPSCTWCQTAKWEAYPQAAGEQTIHPYFDNFEDEVWLHAAVVEVAPASFIFFVDPPVAWGEITADRLRHHLQIFRLPELYTSNASHELLNIRHRLGNLRIAGGINAVRAHLTEEAAARQSNRLNSWQTAMYRAAAGSDWFCDGGFAME